MRVFRRPRTATAVRSLALGTVLGLIASAGTIALVGASDAPMAASFVPITPCRLMDTRPTSTVGPRNTPLGANETYTAQVTGSNGQCTIPAEATAIVINVTGVSPTARTFVTLFPADASKPNASNLNFVAGQSPTPNLVTVTLSATGAVKLYNSAGTVHLLGDIAGYYQPVAPGPQGPAGNPNRISNEQIALLQWGNMDFATGDHPYGVAYDGTSVWVGNRYDDTVSRIDPLSGTKTNFAAGDDPRGIAYDGSNIWVANYGSNTVSRISPATGAKTDFTVGNNPEGVVWDGANIWVSNSFDNTVWRLEPGSGFADVFTTGGSPGAMAFDGTFVWVANIGTNSVSRIHAITGARNDFATGMTPIGVAFDGSHIWVTNLGSSNVSRLDPATGSKVDFATGTSPMGVAFDGSHIWVANNGGATISKFEANGTRTDYGMNGVTSWLAFDGHSLWVVNPARNAVTRFVD